MSKPHFFMMLAMIAAAAYPKFLLKDFAAMDFSAEAGLLLR